MSTVASPHARTDQPDAETLHRVLGHLVRQGDSVGVVRLVERWAELGSISGPARMAEARAFLQLRQMDRAWVRLREATESEPGDVQALLLTAEMFIERGWPARARKVLEQVKAVDSENAAAELLVAQAAEPPFQPPANARDLERDGEVGEQVALAERYLATGSVIRARTLLDAVLRKQPDHKRAEQLMWGIRGEFTTPGQPLAELARDITRSADAAEWADADHTESAARSCLFAEADIGDREREREGEGRPAFPSLFRRPDLVTLPGDRPRLDDDVTMSAVMASREELLDPPTEEATDSGVASLDDSGDTQILQVIGQTASPGSSSGGSAGPTASTGPTGPRLGPSEGPLHKPSAGGEGADPLRQTLDLRAWQQSMGVQPSGPHLSGEDVEEDDATGDDGLVVLKKKEERPSTPEPEPQRRGPIEVIPKHPIPDPLPAGLPGDDEDTPAAHAALRSDSALAPRSAEGHRQTAARRLAPIWLGLIAFALIAALAVVCLLLVLRGYLRGHDIERVHSALEVGDPAALRELRDQLREDTEGKRWLFPVDAKVAELALVSAVLWSDYTGDAADREAALTAIQLGAKRGAPDEEIALAQAQLDVGEGDLVGARVALERVDRRSAEGRYLAARVQLAGGDAEAAARIWGDAKAGGARHAAILPMLRPDASARQRAGAALLEAEGESPLVIALAAEQGWIGGDATQRLAAVDARLAGRPLPPRVTGRLQVVRAGLLLELGLRSESDAAWAAALLSDPASPSAIYHGAAALIAEGLLLRAEGELTRCLSLAERNEDCRRGLVQVLLDLDRGQRANELLVSWGSGGDAETLRAWLEVAQDKHAEAAARMSGLLKDRQRDGAGADGIRNEGLALFVMGLALGPDVELRSATDTALEKAHQRLLVSTDPFDRPLAIRAAAARVQFGPPEQVEAGVRAMGDRDYREPLAHVHLGLALEAAGKEGAAAQHFDRAALLGPENARVLYAQGLFYFDPRRNIPRALTVWDRYLSLDPTGPRADRVRSRLDAR